MKRRKRVFEPAYNTQEVGGRKRKTLSLLENYSGRDLRTLPGVRRVRSNVLDKLRCEATVVGDVVKLKLIGINEDKSDEITIERKRVDFERDYEPVGDGVYALKNEFYAFTPKGSFIDKSLGSSETVYPAGSVIVQEDKGGHEVYAPMVFAGTYRD